MLLQTSLHIVLQKKLLHTVVLCSLTIQMDIVNYIDKSSVVFEKSYIYTSN